jgi:hypothetical protein
MMMSQSKSPIREDEKPLPLPGESLRDEIDDIVTDKLLFVFASALAVLYAAIASWVTYFSKGVIIPASVSIVAVGYIIYFIYSIIRTKKRARAIHLGIEGERSVAAVLETLRREPYVVEILHDIPRQDGNDRWNIDHLVVTTKSLFVIETKARSKRNGSYRARYDGEVIRLDGSEGERDPINQVRAIAGDVQRYLDRITGNKPHIRPVVLIPGWFVEIECKMGGPDETWAMNPKMFVNWIRKEPERITPQDAALYAERLRQWSRDGVAKRKASK